MSTFEQINRGFNAVFQSGELSIGIVIPIENYARQTVPTLRNHLERVQLVEQLGFKAIWVRDVPLHVPTFGDAGQTFDPFTYLGFLAGQTTKIALGTASIALPLHHPIHVAKSAATIDQLSNGRLILGVASGDRPSEYPAMGIEFDNRGETFREAFAYIRKAQENFPTFDSKHFGRLNGQSDILPKASTHKLPLLVTGNSRQSVQWIAEHSDGWIYYPRNSYMQQSNIEEFRQLIPKASNFDKPFMQSLYVDLHPNNDHPPQGIHLGFRLGVNYLIDFFQQLKNMGVNHVAINLRLNSEKIESTLERLAKEVLPLFH